MGINTIEIAALMMFFIALYGLIISKDILKSIISVVLMETAVIIFFLGIGYSRGSTPPLGEHLQNVSDPLPQAFVITAIIIGVVVTAVNLIMFISLYRKYKITDWITAEKDEIADTQNTATSIAIEESE
jgi:multicomponent Na+:H+ antiporter subunit C